MNHVVDSHADGCAIIVAVSRVHCTHNSISILLPADVPVRICRCYRTDKISPALDCR